MMTRRSMLDDNEPSPRSYGLSKGSEARTERYANTGDDSPTASYDSVAPTVAYEADVKSKREGDKGEKKSSKGKMVLVFLLIVAVALLIARCVGWFGGGESSDSSDQSAQFVGSSSHDISSSFAIKAFADSLSEGDCFVLVVDPVWGSDGRVEQMKYTDGRVVDCSSGDAQYRFVSKEEITSNEEWEIRQHKNPDLERLVWESTGDEYTFSLLPFNARFVISEFSSDGSYRYYERYVAPDYSLPSGATQGGVLDVSKDKSSCQEKKGTIRKIDGVDMCLSIVERK